MEGTFPQFNNVSGYFNIDQGLTVSTATTIGGDLSVDGGTFFYDVKPKTVWDWELKIQIRDFTFMRDPITQPLFT